MQKRHQGRLVRVLLFHRKRQTTTTLSPRLAAVAVRIMMPRWLWLFVAVLLLPHTTSEPLKRERG